MAAKTPIEWTDATWPVLAGCKEISPGCANCYAARLTATRLSQQPKYKGLAVIGKNGHPHFTGETRLWTPHLDWPLKWKRPRKIFVADMSDLFYEGVSDEDIAAIFGVMAATPQHTYQILTKRAERMARWFEWAAEQGNHLVGAEGDPPPGVGAAASACAIMAGEKVLGPKAWRAATAAAWPLPNVWIGVSVENQDAADRRIPHLLRVPAAVRFLSVEPLLGPVRLTRALHLGRCPVVVPGTDRSRCGLSIHVPDMPHTLQVEPRTPWVGDDRPIDWVIVGGESGPGARPCDLAHVRSVVDQCKAAGVPVFVKQLGANPVDGDAVCEECRHPRADHGAKLPAASHHGADGTTMDPDRPGYGCRCMGFVGAMPTLCDKKGGDMAEWAAELRVREFPAVRPAR